MAFDNSVRTLVWGERVGEDIFLRWAQGFVFSSAEPLALVQYSGGPCAVLASVQGFMLQRRLFQTKSNFSMDSDNWRACSETEVYDLLVEALVNILTQGASDKFSVALLDDKGLNALQLQRRLEPKGEEPSSCDLHPGNSGDSQPQPQADPMEPTSMDVENAETGVVTAPPDLNPAGLPSHVTLHHNPITPQSRHLVEDNMLLPAAAMDDFLHVVSQSHYGESTLSVPSRDPHTFTVDSIYSTLQNMEKRGEGSGGHTRQAVDTAALHGADMPSGGKKPKLEPPPVTTAGGVNVAAIIDQFHQHIRVAAFNTSSDALQCLRENISDYKGPFGVLLFLYSLILTKGMKDLLDELEDVNDPLIHGVHGYGSQNLVNLLLVGRAATNVFDHDKDLGGIKLRGIPRQATVGFLTLLEAFRYCEVGTFLKSPIYPIWVTGSETHLTLTFSTENNLAFPEDFVTIARREFGKLDHEGNGFIPSTSLRSLLTTLNLETDPGYVSYMIEKLDPDSLGMVLLGNFLSEFCPNMPGESILPQAFPIYHYNGLLQSSKDGKVSFAKGSAVVLSETTGLSAADTLLNCLHSKWPGLVVNWEGGVEPKIN